MTILSRVPGGYTFLEAKRRVASASPAQPIDVFLGMSGTADPLILFVEAAALDRGRSARIRVAPFGTLHQALIEKPNPGVQELLLLFPWDLLPEADWRTGVSSEVVEPAEGLARAQLTLTRLTGRAGAKIVYVAAPIPPLARTPEATVRLETMLVGAAAEVASAVLAGECFSLNSYLASGFPLAGNSLGGVANVLVDAALGIARQPAKVLVTDFDNTLWAGVLAEDGEGGVAHQASGRGYRHFLFQTLLKRLRSEGVLLAGVTRNAPEVVDPILSRGEMILDRSDFVAVVATYGAKSPQIESLAQRLNLGLDSFVVVDDNEVELAEIRLALPKVRCVRFPSREDELPGFLGSVAALFGKEHVSAEDRERTDLYRRRMDGLVPEAMEGADVADFLRTLAMELAVQDRSTGDRTRAVQLINKTNQFNANGRRWSDEEVGELLARGGRLLTASLRDRSGSHGEIVACLLDPEGIVEAWVMSCRVFSRRVEFAFLLALCQQGFAPRAFRFARTDRNEPFVQFLAQIGAPANGGQEEPVAFDPAEFERAHGTARELFQVRW